MNKEFRIYRCIYHNVQFLHLWCVIRWNSDRQRAIDRHFNEIVMKLHCSELSRVSPHISVHISNGDCQFPLLPYMVSCGLTGTISGVLLYYLVRVLPYLAYLYVAYPYLACLQIWVFVTRFHITITVIQQSLCKWGKNIYTVEPIHEEFAF